MSFILFVIFGISVPALLILVAIAWLWLMAAMFN